MVFQLLEWNILVVNDTLLGDPPKDSFFGVCKKKKKGWGRGGGGASGGKNHIAPFRSLKKFTYFDLVWWQLLLNVPYYTILNLSLLVPHFIFCNMSCTFCNIFHREIHDSIQAQKLGCMWFMSKSGLNTLKYIKWKVYGVILFIFLKVFVYKTDYESIYFSSVWQPYWAVILGNIFRNEWIAIDLRWSFITQLLNWEPEYLSNRLHSL